MQTGIFLEISPLPAGGAPTAPGLAGIVLCGGHGERAQPGIQSETQERGGPLAHLGARLWVHGIREWWNFRGWKRPQGPATLSMMSSSHIHTFPGHSQGWRLPHCPFPVFTALPMNFFSPTSDLNKRWKSLRLVRPGLGSGALRRHLEISRSRVTEPMDFPRPDAVGSDSNRPWRDGRSRAQQERARTHRNRPAFPQTPSRPCLGGVRIWLSCDPAN